MNVSDFRALFEKCFSTLFDGSEEFDDAMRYACFGGGKRVRPVGVYLGAASVSAAPPLDEVLSLAGAIELVHSYSLVHDDLPAMDNDELRRGVRTCHLQYGEAAAILAGDGLLNLAMELVFKGKMEDKYYRRACAYMFEKSGQNGMLYGQCLDLFAETKSFEDANEVALHKTGDLIRAALVCGALCGHAADDEVKIFDEIAVNFGIAYQVVDDLLDAQKCEKSFLDVMTERECRQYAQQLTDKVLSLCDQLPQYDLQFIKDYATQNLSRNH